jgi:hypothetical protein
MYRTHSLWQDVHCLQMAVNVVITGLGADYTSLGSFGTADAFAENLVRLSWFQNHSKVEEQEWTCNSIILLTVVAWEWSLVP